MNRNETNQVQRGRINMSDQTFLRLVFAVQVIWIGLLIGGGVYAALSMLREMRMDQASFIQSSD